MFQTTPVKRITAHGWALLPKQNEGKRLILLLFFWALFKEQVFFELLEERKLGIEMTRTNEDVYWHYLLECAVCRDSLLSHLHVKRFRRSSK
jgi:hypothetical protein